MSWSKVAGSLPPPVWAQLLLLFLRLEAGRDLGSGTLNGITYRFGMIGLVVRYRSNGTKKKAFFTVTELLSTAVDELWALPAPPSSFLG